MVDPTVRERVDAFWSSTLDTSVADLHSPGVTVRPQPPVRADWRGIYVLGFEGANVYAPSDMVESVRATVAGQDLEALLEHKTWEEQLGDLSKSAWGPVRHYYLTSTEHLTDLVAGRRLNPRDSEAISGLRAAVPTREWAVTGFTAQTAMLFGIFEDDKLVAAANLTPGPDAATDVGFVIHPESRGRGYGPRIAALAAKQAIMMHGIARYRALTSSPSTMAIADKLGFTEYGRNMVVYLQESQIVMP